MADSLETGESALVELVEMMARLRAECGWKAAQTHRTLARHLLEETYETLEAIETGDPAHLCEELGDVLLQVYLHAAIAAQAGEFDIEDVARGLREKMLRRNPHVFGDVVESDPARINETWETVKGAEKRISMVASASEGTQFTVRFGVWQIVGTQVGYQWSGEAASSSASKCSCKRARLRTSMARAFGPSHGAAA